MDSIRSLLIAFASVAAAFSATPAAAAFVTEVDTSYTVGVQGRLSIDSFSVAGPGTVTVTLSELSWPSANLTGLSFELASGTNQVVGLLSAAGTQTFSLSAAGTYYALSFAQALPATGPLLLPFATYGLSISYSPADVPSPVPLPPSLPLLASALLALTLVFSAGDAARRRRRTADPA